MPITTDLPRQADAGPSEDPPEGPAAVLVADPQLHDSQLPDSRLTDVEVPEQPLAGDSEGAVEVALEVALESRAVRKDAARNRERLLVAADELFSLHGVDITLDDIAKHTGVGVATAYRHFPNKWVLLQAVFELRIARFSAVLEELAEIEDPRRGLEMFFERVGAIATADRGLREALGANHKIVKAAELREQMRVPLVRMIDAAHANGTLRPEFTINDVPLVLRMIMAVFEFAEEQDPDLWRRYLGFLLDGLDAEGTTHRPAAVAPLSEQQLEAAMEAWPRDPPRR